MHELSEILAALRRPANVSVLATLVTVRGSSYRRPGARLLLQDGVRRTGSISGGCLEEDVMARAQIVGQTGRAELVTYDTTTENDLVWGVGLGCHGVVQVLIERLNANASWIARLATRLAGRESTELTVVWASSDPAHLGTHLREDAPVGFAGLNTFQELIEPPVRLLIFGAGDDAQPLTKIAKELGWTVTVADPRPAFVTAKRFPGADSLLTGPSAELATKANPAPDSVCVVMTHHYVHDVPILCSLLAHEVAYIGLLGPKQRAQRILEDLAKRAQPAPISLDRLHAPVGLDLGAETPAEVALSIVAEIQSVLRHRSGQPLRRRERPIHE